MNFWRLCVSNMAAKTEIKKEVKDYSLENLVNPELVKVVHETANDLINAKGYTVHLTEGDVEIVLKALRLVKITMDTKEKIRK